MFLSALPGDYVLRDPAGGPRGMVRIMIKWKYPFLPTADDSLVKQGRQNRATESTGTEERRREEEESQKPIAKPRVKVILNSAVSKSLGIAMLPGTRHLSYVHLFN